MNSRYLRALELDKILARLAAHTAFAASEQLARALAPLTDPDELARRQGETTEAVALLDQHPETSVGGARDVRPLARAARIGAILAPTDLLEVRQTLIAARTLRRSLGRFGELYPRLAARAALLEELPTVVDAIGRAVNDRGEIVNSASPALARIRGELNVVRGRLMDKLQRLIASAANAKYIQEAIITERDGRYVIPIRAESKGRIPGITHDTSASGATLFIEPLSTVEMGNRVRELEREETREIERILRELTDLIAAHADALDATVATLAELDLAFAKAKYSVEIRGVEPQLEVGNWTFDVGDWKLEGATRSNPQPPISNFQPLTSNLHLLAARHPLLDPTQVVPVSLELGGAFSILVITGPNTGGKTVTLKTIGLLALMAQCGLHIPANPGSRLPIFSGIFADIGDEQSIEQSLSTFSGHLKNIIEILRDADAHSLVLLDELGAGTDPVEGSALARAILDDLLARRVPALVATHYAELKAFAQTTPGVQNASVEFDVETLSPTYHLVMGLPGKSNAFAIATRLGLDRAIIARAQESLSGADVELEKMLAEIKRARQDAISAQAHAEIAQRDAEQRAAEARRLSFETEQARAKILDRAHAEAQAEIALAREELNRLRQEWRAVSVARDFVAGEQAKLENLAKELPTTEPPPLPSPFKGEGRAGVGDHVWVARLQQAGQVIALDANGADVQVGNFRVRLKANELGDKVAPPMSAFVPKTSEVKLPEAENPGVEISLRGMRADDALDTLEKYLDRAYLAGLPYVRIVHGKGTGTLRKLARDLLRGHPLVAQIREAEAHEGGEGVTIAKLISR
ncbi:MAG: Smr/MutS family protein [Chloroflexi bacterium]|nr:Smr/MutS family protein [Chloroflexota bacterium]